MQSLVEELKREYAHTKAQHLPRMLESRFEPGNARYGIPQNLPSTRQAKLRKGRPPIAGVNTSRLRQAMRTALWRVDRRYNLSAILPGYLRELLARGWPILALTQRERKQILMIARSRVAQRRAQAGRAIAPV